MLSEQHEPSIIHQNGHTDETRFLAVAKYFSPMMLPSEKY